MPIYRTQYYELDYDPTRNQINYAVKGSWPSVEAVADLERHWLSLLVRAGMSPIKLLADMTEMKPFAPRSDVEALHIRLQQRAIEAGARIAVVVAKSAVSTLTARRLGRETGTSLAVREFTDRAKAQAWLDEQVPDSGSRA